MDDNAARALGDRWLKAGGGWRPGMLWRVSRPAPLENYWGRICERGLPPVGPGWPDFRDPATRGAALEVVRERLGAPDAVCARVCPWAALPRWAVWPDAGDLIRWAAGERVSAALFSVVDGDPVWAASEAEAIVIALEAAP